MLKALKDLLIRNGQIEKHVAKLDARVRGLRNDSNTDGPLSKAVTKINAMEQKDLLELDLPVKSTEALNNLEENH